MWYSSGNGHINLQITLVQAQQGSHQGQCDADIAELRKVPKIRRQLEKIDAQQLRDELDGYGAWDSIELADHDINLTRILWLACGDIAQEHDAKKKPYREPRWENIDKETHCQN